MERMATLAIKVIKGYSGYSKSLSMLSSSKIMIEAELVGVHVNDMP